jgi:hypothetical protein
LTTAAEATAGGLRVSGRIAIRTPGVQVTIGQRDGVRRVVRRTARQEAGWRYHQLSERDKAQARRLAVHTGIPKNHFLELRLRGYSWREVAHRLDLPMRMVHAARTAETWRDFRRPQVRRCGNG